MKKVISLFLTAFFAMALFVSVPADAAEDPFYIEHQTECRVSGEEYEAQTAVSVLVSPEAAEPMGELAAGTVVSVEQIWPSGPTWGYIAYGEGGGWIALDRCRRLYNADDFLSEHGAEIADGSGVALIPEGGAVYFWTFPGSGVSVGSVDGAETDTGPAYDRTYTDENGGSWGLTGYFHGQHGWIYLDDPAADSLPATAPRYAPEPAKDSSFTLPESLPALAASCVILAAAVIASFVLAHRRRQGDITSP